MEILYYFNIKGDKKGILATEDINTLIASATGNYYMALEKVKGLF